MLVNQLNIYAKKTSVDNDWPAKRTQYIVAQRLMGDGTNSFTIDFNTKK